MIIYHDWININYNLTNPYLIGIKEDEDTGGDTEEYSEDDTDEEAEAV